MNDLHVEQTLGSYLASKLKNAQLSEWNMAPSSFDFRIVHDSDGPVADETLKKLVKDYYGSRLQKGALDRFLIGVVILDGNMYTLTISNFSLPPRIDGTLQLF